MTTEDKNTRVINVQILDRNFPVKCGPEQADELIKSAHHLNQKARKIEQSTSLHNFERILSITALNITHDLLFKDHSQSGDSTRAVSSDVNQRIAKLQRKVEDALKSLPANEPITSVSDAIEQRQPSPSASSHDAVDSSTNNEYVD